jgi:GNAT superfamily N-acetyltransferase
MGDSLDQLRGRFASPVRLSGGVHAGSVLDTEQGGEDAGAAESAAPMKTIDDLRYRNRYWDDRPAREAFQRFLIEIHGLDLGEWERRGFWDREHYLPYSLFDGDRVVASLCVYSLDLRVDGERRRIGQFSGVGTAPGRRRQGLNRWLTERAIEELGPSHDGFFLFSTEGAVPFYRACGFEPLLERGRVLAVEAVRPRAGARPLDLGSDGDLALLHRMVRDRTPVSDVLASLGTRLTMFHALYGPPDRILFVPELDVVVFRSVAAGRLTLADVIGPRMPSFDELHPYLTDQPHREVRFGFGPDRMGVEGGETEELADNLCHVWPGSGLPAREFVFPETCHA